MSTLITCQITCQTVAPSQDGLKIVKEYAIEPFQENSLSPNTTLTQRWADFSRAYEGYVKGYASLRLATRIRNSAEKPPSPPSLSKLKTKLENAAQAFQECMYNWLESSELRQQLSLLGSQLQDQKSQHERRFRVFLKSDDPTLWLLDWEAWIREAMGVKETENLTVVFGRATSSETVNIINPQTPTHKIGILCLKGDEDRQVIRQVMLNWFEENVENLEDKVGELAEIHSLAQPPTSKLVEKLRKPFSFLYYIGHSDFGVALNRSETPFHPGEKIPRALKKSVRQGMQIMMFNSCKSWQFSEQLASLGISFIIGWRQVVDVRVADSFLCHFLKHFVSHNEPIEWAFYEAWKDTLEQYQDKPTLLPQEGKNLPILVVNNQEALIQGFTWWSLFSQVWRAKCQEWVRNKRQLASNLFTAGEGIRVELDDIHVPLGLVERKKKPKKNLHDDFSPEKGSLVYHEQEQEKEEEQETFVLISYDDFFQKVLAQGKSPKSKGKRISIIGEPGAGKTTQLLKIADWVLKTNGVPIWISLGETEGTSLDKYLYQDWLTKAFGRFGGNPADDWIRALEQLLSNGKVWLLLDGADEMSVHEPLGNLARVLSLPQFNQVRVVVTCRLNVWDATRNSLSEFDTYKMLDFSYGDSSNPDQVQQFIDKWFSATEDIGQQLRQELEQPGKERIKDLARNPLRLALLCFYWGHNQGGLPDTKAGLYSQFVEALYELKQDVFPIKLEQKWALNKALGQLAKKAIDEGAKSILSERLVVQELGAELFELSLQLGWLNRVGVEPKRLTPVYAFFHPTFQEYFAATAVDDWDYFLPREHRNQPVWEKKYRIFEPRWKEAILLWLGREDIDKEEKDKFIGMLVEFEDGCGKFYQYRAYFLAAGGIAELKGCSRKEQIGSQLVEWCFGKHFIGKEAREVLKDTGSKQWYDTIVGLISCSQDESTRRESVESSGKIDIRNPTAITALFDLSSHSQNEWSRKKTVESLERNDTGNRTAINDLVNIIFNPPSYYQGALNPECIRMKAAESLAKIDPGNPTAINTLVDLISHSQSDYTRFDAAESLAKIDLGNPTAINALVNITFNPQDDWNQSRARMILWEIGPMNPTVINALVNLISQSQDKSTRIQAANFLLGIDPGNLTAIITLTDAISKSQDKFTRIKAAESLAKIDPGNFTAINTMVNLISHFYSEYPIDDYYECIEKEVEILGKIGLGNPAAINTLVNIISHSQNNYTRFNVAKNLGRIDPRNTTAIDALVDVISDYQANSIKGYLSEDIVESAIGKAAKSLGRIDPRNSFAIDALVDLISHSQYKWIRREAAESLGEIDIGNPNAINALVDLISHSQDEWSLQKTAESLGKIGTGNPTAINALVDLISHSQDESTIMNAAESLGTIDPGNFAAINALANIISHSQYDYTRIKAVETLWKIDPGNSTSISALVHIILNPQIHYPDANGDNVRYTALKSLAKILDKPHMAEVVSTAKDNPNLQNNLDYFQLIWKCAQNMTYPAFYQEWHDRPINPDPVIPEPTFVGTTSETVKLDFNNLPQNLNQRINNNPKLKETVRVICIDRTQFIDPHNPSQKIYTQIVKSGYPKSEDGTPKTMVDLQTYWDLLESEPKPILIFYDSTALSTEPKGFSDTFLNTISKFEGAICAIADQATNELKQFSPSDLQLLDNIVKWIERLITEEVIG